MPEVFLIPYINLFDVHDSVFKDWFSTLEEKQIRNHLEYPFKLERFFTKTSKRVISNIDEIHTLTLNLLNYINPEAVFLDISTDFIELENEYNKRAISSTDFWLEYYQCNEESHILYRIYIADVVNKMIKLIENKEHLPLSVVFYGCDIKTRNEFIPVYENIIEKDSDFSLQVARTVNEITQLRETPKHIWHTQSQERTMGISYEETEKFYTEVLSRIKRFLKFKVRTHVVKNLKNKSFEFIPIYEEFLKQKIKQEKIKLSNIHEGLEVLNVQSDFKKVVVLCDPLHYFAFMVSLKPTELNIKSLLDKMTPFIQKNRIMQNNYEIALNILDSSPSS